MSDVESAGLNAQLVLLLGNHIGDLSVIREALSVARAVGYRSASAFTTALGDAGLPVPSAIAALCASLAGSDEVA